MTTSVPAAPAAAAESAPLRIATFTVTIPAFDVQVIAHDDDTDELLCGWVGAYLRDSIREALSNLDDLSYGSGSRSIVDLQDAPILGDEDIVAAKEASIASAVEILRSYKRNKILSEEQLATLDKAHQDFIDLICHLSWLGVIQELADQLGTAPADLCDAADIPTGSSWAELIAAVLDSHHGTGRHMHALAHTSHEVGVAIPCNKELG